MAPPIASSKVFPPMVVSMVEVGEETGALPDMLNKIADSYDDDVDNAVAVMTSIIEPVLIIFLAVVVGTIVIALFLPLVSIIGASAADDGSGARRRAGEDGRRESAGRFGVWGAERARFRGTQA